MEYLPFGETLVDEHLNSRNSPFKYNGKEFDEETGNYYYGARYYDPKWSIWVSVDPLAEKFPSHSSYNYTFNNPIRFVDPNGMAPDDIIFIGTDKKQIRIIAPGDNIPIFVPFELGRDMTVDFSAPKIDGGRFAYGYTVQTDVNIGVGIVAQYGGEISVVNFTDDTYGGYNYVYAGGHEAGSIGLQSSASGSIGGSLFVAYNDNGKEISPSSFAGLTYSSSLSADIKLLEGGGISLSKFSSVKDPKLEKGWKGISIAFNIGIGGSANFGSTGEQVSTTTLFNDIKPTSQRSFTDKASNSIAPITSTILKLIGGE